MAAKTGELIGPGGASRILEVSTESVRNFARDGRLPVVMTVDGRRLYPLDAVKGLAAQRRANRG